MFQSIQITIFFINTCVSTIHIPRNFAPISYTVEKRIHIHIVHIGHSQYTNYTNYTSVSFQASHYWNLIFIYLVLQSESFDENNKKRRDIIKIYLIKPNFYLRGSKIYFFKYLRTVKLFNKMFLLFRARASVINPSSPGNSRNVSKCWNKLFFWILSELFYDTILRN